MDNSLKKPHIIIAYDDFIKLLNYAGGFVAVVDTNAELEFNRIAKKILKKNPDFQEHYDQMNIEEQIKLSSRRNGYV